MLQFVKKHSHNVMTFVILVVRGKNMLRNSNMIEGLMGEIQKRCKHKWICWITQKHESI